MDNLIDAPRLHADALAQPVLADTQWFDEVFQENLAGMDRR
jgi:hypothetical protein